MHLTDLQYPATQVWTKFEPNTTYHFRISACYGNTLGTANYQPVAAVLGVPHYPTDFTATLASGYETSRINLSWEHGRGSW
jgi:hypothetical protein